MKFIKWLPLAAISFLIVGCGSDDSAAYKTSASYADADMSDESASRNYMGADSSPSSSQTPPALTEMSTANMTQQRRQVIRNGEISLRVEDVRQTAREITDMVVNGGGYVASTNASDSQGENPGVTMTIKVKSAGFDDAMLSLEEMGIYLGGSSNTRDVTSEIVDLGVRVKTLTAKEDTFREMLRQSRNTNDIITLQNRLTEVRTEIERMEAQRISLSQLASLSTIKIQLTENATMPAEAKDPNWLGENFASTTSSFMGSVRGVVGVLMWIVIYSPFWAIPLLGGIWLKKKYGRTVTTTTTQ